MFDYDDRCFVPVENAKNSEVGGEIIFHYHQKDVLAWATYE